MNLIRKGTPPGPLTTYRFTPDRASDPPRASRYNDDDQEFTVTVKPAMREALVAEQRGVCCYCTDRIAATNVGMKIEHRVPQRGPAGDASRGLDWTNLLGACCGVKPNPMDRGAMVLHCDSAKGEDPITLDPTNPSHMAAIGYRRSGHVTSTIPRHQSEIDDVLRLNGEALVDLRSRAVDALRTELGLTHDARSLPKAKLQKLLAETNNPSGQQLRPFSGFLCWWLERAIRKAG